MLVRDGFTALLNNAGYHAVAEATDAGPELSSALAARSPDVVLIGPGSAASVLEQIPNVGETWRTIIVAPAHDAALQSAAIQQGVRGIVTPDQSGDIILKAVHKVGAGEYWLTRERL